MSQTHPYTEFHPRWYRTRVSTYWWLQRGAYLAFILRELSSVFIAWFIIFTLLLVSAVKGGEESYLQFLTFARHPLVVAVNLVTLFFVVFHAATWFNLAPKALVVRLRGQRVPPFWIAASNYAAWVLVTGFVVWLILWEG
jgi:fumarate reductase subunit C